MNRKRTRYTPPVFKPPADPTDIASFPNSDPRCPWRPISEPPTSGVSFGIFLPTGEQTNGVFYKGKWFTYAGEVHPLAWCEIVRGASC